MTVDGSKWLFGRSTDGAIVSYTIERDGTTLLSMSTAGTAKIGDKTVLTDAVIVRHPDGIIAKRRRALKDDALRRVA